MKLAAMFFMFIAFATFKFMVLGSAAPTEQPIVPTLTLPDIDFLDVTFTTSDACTGGSEWLWWTGIGTVYCAGANFVVNAGDTAAAIANMFLAVYWFVLVIFHLGTFVAEMVFFMGDVLLTDIDDAPAWLNLILFTPFALMFGVIIYRLFRSGASED